jgi:hypothetical protein
METRRVDQWEWEVFRVRNRELIGSGTSRSLENAKEAAEEAARQLGFDGPFDWKDIGPSLP